MYPAHRRLLRALSTLALVALTATPALAAPVPAASVDAIEAELAAIHANMKWHTKPTRALVARSGFRLNAAAGTIEQLQMGKVRRRIRADKPLTPSVRPSKGGGTEYVVSLTFLTPDANTRTASIYAPSRGAAERIAAAFERIETLAAGTAKRVTPKPTPARRDDRASAAGEVIPYPLRDGQRMRMRYRKVVAELPGKRRIVRIVGHETRYGVIEKHSGHAVLAGVYDEMRSTGGGYVAAKKGGKWGLIDVRRGPARLVTPHAYDEIDRQIVEDGPIVARKGRRWGAVGRDGRVAVPFVYAKMKHFSDGLAPVTQDGERWGYVDVRGRVAIPIRYTWANPFFRGKATVSTKPPRAGVGLGPRTYELFTIDTSGREVAR